MSFSPLPSVARLRSLYTYEPETGALISHYDDRPLHNVDPKGYLRIVLDGRGYKVSRIIWKMMTGQDPTKALDHKNGNRSDNRWGNLREVTDRQNSQNKKVTIRNTAGLKGTRRVPPKGARPERWQAKICVDGRDIYLGTFNTPQEAHAAYKAAALEHFGAFARY